MKFVLAILIVAIGLPVGCKKTVEAPPEPINKFPAADVCRYPANSTIKKFHFLARDDWLSDTLNAPNSTYRCATEPRVVQLFGSGNDFVNVSYEATGDIEGATTISISYSVLTESTIENESTYRNVYVRFLDEMVQQTLKQELPHLAQRKILNLQSYTLPENSSEESFSVGEGFVLLNRSRSANGKSISVLAQIFSDNALRLK